MKATNEFFFGATPLYNYNEEELTTKDGTQVKIGFNKITVGERVYYPKSEMPLFYLMKARETGAVEAILTKHPELLASVSCNGHSLNYYNEGYDCGMDSLLMEFEIKLAGADGASASAAGNE